MKALSAVLVLVLAASSFGGVVTALNTTGPVAPGTPVSFTVSVTPGAATGGAMQGYALLLGTNLPNAFSSFANLDTVTSAIPGVGIYQASQQAGPDYPVPFDSGSYVYNSYLLAGGAKTTTGTVSGVTVGTLVVNTTGLPAGTYQLSLFDGATVINGAAGDDANITLTGGSFTVVVPEPMTMALLALGGLMVARRRHA